jgi:RND family efflux transporter MFP subunit
VKNLLLFTPRMKTKLFFLLLATSVSWNALGAEPYVATGITEAISDVFLSASVPGIVSAWKFKEGDFVKDNETIIELDKNLEELETTRRKLVLENRKMEWNAIQSLAKKESISVKKEEVDKAETEYRIAAAEHEMAMEQLRKRSVTAPCAGFIAEITRHVGESCQPYQPLIRLVDTRRCYLICNIEGKAADRLKLDQKVKLEIETGSSAVLLDGKISFLSPVVDPASGLAKVKILFDNTAGKVRPGIAGKMHFE